MKVYVGILTKNRLVRLRALLEMPMFAEGLDMVSSEHEVIVVDQGSRDGTREYLAKSEIVNTFMSIKGNLGCAGGRQFIADYAITQGLKSNDWVIFLDDDMVCASDRWVDHLIHPRNLTRAGQVDISGVDGRKVTRDYLTIPVVPGEQPDYVSGGWCAIRGAVFLSGVRFDTRFNPNYWEDVDFGYSARYKGYYLAHAGDVGLIHCSAQDTTEANELFKINQAKFKDKWHGNRNPNERSDQ